MLCKFEELRHKQVVCMHSGEILGYLSDIEINSEDGKVESLVIFGKPRFFGLFGKTEDIIIPWGDIEVIGPETVIIKNSNAICK